MRDWIKDNFFLSFYFCIALSVVLCACGSDDDSSSPSSSATYDLSGTWNYSMTQTLNSEGSLDPEQQGQLVLTQNGDLFTIDVGDGEPENGTITGNHYVIEYSESYNAGTSKHYMYFDASSSEALEGERTSTWTDGVSSLEYRWIFSAQKVIVERTEIWGHSNSEFTLLKDSNGGISITGEWRSGTVVCKMTKGSAEILTDYLSFSGTGIATNPLAPEGYKTSPFTLQSNGYLNNGEYDGNYVLTFTTYGWPSNQTFSAVSTKKSGEGITGY